MAELYYLSLGECAGALEALIPFISKERRERIERLRSKASAIQIAASETLAAHALKRSLPLPFFKTALGKPFVSGARYFNISHSGDFVICAVSDFEIGTDTDCVERFSPRLSNKILSEVELSELSLLPECDKSLYLCKKWMQKESLTKLSGQGLRQDFRTLNLSGAHFRFAKLSQSQSACVCQQRDFELEIYKISSSELLKLMETQNEDKK